MSTVNINTSNNTVSIQDTNQEISVTDNNKNTTVSIPQTNTNIVQVNTPGPQGIVGPRGERGETGSFPNTGSFATTGSNTFNGNQIINGSLTNGDNTTANGDYSHAEGQNTIANGFASHAEGSGTTANGDFSHTEGDNTQANGNYSHAEGQETKTLESAQYSHAEGYNTIASANYQHVQGQWNATSSIPAAFIVGNGTDNNNRSNLIHAAGNAVQITGTQIISGSNGVLRYSGTDANTDNPGYPSLAEIHANNAYPWLERFYNDTFSSSSAIIAYFGWDDGRFVFHNESTQSIGLQVNGYSAENGLLVYEDKVAFVNNVEVTGSLNALSITGSLQGTASFATQAISSSFASTASFAQNSLTASFASTSSRAISSSFASTASYVLNAVSSSFATQAISSSFASTASFSPNYLLLSNTSSMLAPYMLIANTSSMLQPYVLTNITSSMLSPYMLNLSASSFTTTSSFNSFTSSINIATSSFATTGSNIFIGNQTITGSLTVSSSANTQLLIGTNTLFISSSNNVGIGTTNPGVKLDVIGDIRASTTMFNSTTQTNNIQLSSATNLRFLSASIETARYDNNGWGFFNTAPTAKVHISGASADSLLRVGSPTQANALFVSGSGNVGIGTTTSPARFAVSGSNNQTLVNVESPGSSSIFNISGSGNVGIGTSTPGARLDVFGTGQIINMGNGTSTDAYIDFAGNRGKFGFESATGIRFQGTNTRPIVFALGNWGTGEIARFSTQGFFGLNTNNPSAWLHISGTVASSSLLRIDAPGSSSIFEVSGSGVVTINGSIPVTRNATGYNVGRFTNSASFDNIRVAISSSGNPVASSVSGSVNVYYSTISSVVGSAISSSVNTGAIFTTGSWSLLTSATLGSGGDTITSHIQDQDRGRLYRATFIQTAGPTSGSVVIERLI